VRAGLLSDPRVVALLRTLFIPVHVSSLNTAHCMRDPRDVELLRSKISEHTDDFDGGERETFLLPDGTMQTVFLSLNGHAMREYESRSAQYTAAGRRADDALRMFRHHGSIALRAVHGDLPAAWRELLEADHPVVAAIATEAPRWLEPAAGRQGFRVFVRNSYRMYDDLHGQQLVLPDPDVIEAWGGRLEATGSRSELPRAAFVDLARAIVPRGQVDTELAERSITGSLTLVATRVDEQRIEGTVEGTFVLLPTDKAEVGKRENAAALFESKGRLVGTFTWSRAARRLDTLRVAAADVAFTWKPIDADRSYHEPVHRIGIEWVRGPASDAR